MKNRFLRGSAALLALLLALCLAFTGCEIPDSPGELFGDKYTSQDGADDKTSADGKDGDSQSQKPTGEQTAAEKALGVPKFTNKPYAELDGNLPTFEADEITVEAYEYFSPLDELGRCGYVEACVGVELMPTEDRESISSVTPSGWKNKKYDTDLVDGGYIYNRCHLIGFQLTGENANKQNLITGTRYMNVDGMLPFENMVADYVKETENHVMYRVTPVHDGNDLVACGVIVEAYSVEDEGEEISFKVYVYNVQPGIVIDYATGDNWLADEAPEMTEASETDAVADAGKKTYVINKSSKKVHMPTCSGVADMSESNREEYTGNLFDLLSKGYSACGTCDPK